MFEKDVSGINDIKKDVFRINKNDNKKMLLYLSIVASFTVYLLTIKHITVYLQFLLQIYTYRFLCIFTVLHGVLQHFYWLVFCFRPYLHNVYGLYLRLYVQERRQQDKYRLFPDKELFRMYSLIYEE